MTCDLSSETISYVCNMQTSFYSPLEHGLGAENLYCLMLTEMTDDVPWLQTEVPLRK